MPLPRSMFAKNAPRDVDLELVSGSWPRDLTGEMWLASPDPRDAGPHAFFGDGLVYRVSLTPGRYGASEGRFALRQSKVRTPSRRLRDRLPDAWHASQVGTFSAYGPTNGVNTAPLPWGDRMLMTWDGGRPVEIDPVSLDYLGEIGVRDSWYDLQPEFALPFIVAPAHPVTDPDRGCIWNLSYQPGPDGAVHLVRMDPDSERVKRWPLSGCHIPQLSHTISQTREWIIIVDNGMKIDMAESRGAERSVTNNSTEPVYLIRKADADRAPSGTPLDSRRFEIGPESMHFYADYDDSHGVRVFFEHSTDSDISMSVRPGDHNLWGEPIDPLVAGMYGLAQSPCPVTMRMFDPDTAKVTEKARYVDEDVMWSVQTSARDWSDAGQLKPTLHHVMYSGFRPEGITERQVDLYAGRIDRSRWPTEETPSALYSFQWNEDLKPAGMHRFALDEWVTTPVFVPREAGKGGDPYAGGEPGGHDGYVIANVLCDSGYRVEVFDAARVGDGPVAVLASQGYTMPFVIHGAWAPDARPAAHAPRASFPDELRPEQLKGLNKAMKRAALEVAEELRGEACAAE